MASVSFSPGAANSTTNYLQWQDRDAPVALADASALSSDADPRYIQRLRIWKTTRTDKIYLNAKRTTPDGTSAFDSGDELSSAWELSESALSIAAGGQTWTFDGPQVATNMATDDTEPYGWNTGTSEVNDFITAYEALTQAQRDATVITLDDGQAATTMPPEQVMRLRLSTAFNEALLLAWDAAVTDAGKPVTGYEYELDGGTWTATGSADTMFRLTGLSPGTSYDIRVRAVNADGEGPASTTLTASTTAAEVPGAIRFLSTTAPGGTVVDLEFIAPLTDGGADITHYQVCVVDEDGTTAPFEDTDDASTTWRVRGLAVYHRYGFRVRAVNAAGPGPQSAIVYETPVPRLPAVVAPAGQRIPLLDEVRQSLIVRMAEIDCRLTVWWQPRDSSWYATLEVPTNTVRVAGRRLALNAGLLDRTTDVLPGNIVLRELGDTGIEPARDAWRTPTHQLRWEPA